MRKRLLAVAAATVMTMSMAMTAMAAVPTDYVGYYSFDDTLANEKGGEAELTGSDLLKATEVKATEATFVDGVNGKAVSFTGTGSYGLKLDSKLTKGEFSFSFKTKVHATTFATPWIFLEDMGGEKTPEKWTALLPLDVAATGFTGANAPKIWSRNDGIEKAHYAATAAENDKLALDKWVDVTWVCKQETDDMIMTVYVDGEAVLKSRVLPEGEASDTVNYKVVGSVIGENTNIILGVNYWDVPLNADIDDLYVFDRALTADEIKEITGFEVKDTVTLEAKKEVEKLTPAKADGSASYLVTPEPKDDGLSTTAIYGIVAGVAVVVVVIVLVIALKSSKKSDSEDDDDEE